MREAARSICCVLARPGPSPLQEVTMSEMKADDVRATVREHYGNIARGTSTGCAPGCCSTVGTAAATLGYTTDQAAAAPEGADLGPGWGDHPPLQRLPAGA